MKVIFYICVLVLLLNLTGAQTEISKKTIFKELIYSDKGKAVFILNNSDSILSGDSLKINFNEVCGHVVNYKIYINSTCSRQDPVYSIKKECYNISVYDNKTLNNSIREVCANVSFISDYKNVSFLCEIELKTIPKNLSKIRIDAEIQYEMCKDGLFGYKIDWIPSLTTSDKKIYSEISWAWWNSSYSQKINVTNLSISNLGIHLNLIAGFCGYQVLFNPSQCGSSDIAFFYNTCADPVLICNGSTSGVRMNAEFTTNASLSYQSQSVYTSDLLFYVPFDANNSITQYDSTLNGNNFTVTTSVWSSTATYGGSMYFDANDDYLVSTKKVWSNSSVTEFTIEMWVKPDVTNHDDCIFMLGTGVVDLTGKPMILLVSDVMYFGMGQWNTVGYAVPSKSVFSHLVFIWNKSKTSNNLQYYLNGVLQTKVSGSEDYTSIMDASNYYAVIGLYATVAAHSFGGRVDEVSFFMRALTPTEIEEKFNESVGKYNNLAANETCPVNRVNASFINNTLCINFTQNGTITEFDNNLCPLSTNITYNITNQACACNSTWSNVSVINLTECVNYTWNTIVLQTDISLCNFSNQTVYDYDVYCNVSCIPDPYSSAWILNYSTECINNSYTNFYYRYEWDNNNCTIFLDYFYKNEIVSCGEDLHYWFDVNFALLINIIFFTLILIGILWALGKLMER